jgi:pyruvate dehydrogenase E2 component (dihydrolipoamide acetyltransferase)
VGTPETADESRSTAGQVADAGTTRVAAQTVSVISPLVRKIARDAGLDLAAIRGSGPDGVVRRQDIEDALHRRVAHADVPSPAANAADWPPGDHDLRRIPITGVRRLIAEKMSRSRREIPEATVWVDVDASDLIAARAAINSRMPERPVSILALFARFALLGLRSYPELNSRIDGDDIVLPSHVHLGIAAQTDRGLVVPVIRDAERLSARDLSDAISVKATAARAGKLPPQDLSGGTFTVNNYGIFGVDGSAAIINHPEVAILGLGRIIDRPWVVGGQVVPRKIAQLTLTFDHRVCDGGVAGGFLRFVADCVEAPVGVIADL